MTTGLQKRLVRAETERSVNESEPSDEDSNGPFVEALQTIAATMDAGEFAGVFTEILNHLKSDNPLDTTRFSFVAARVYSLATRAANGFTVALLMPPALSAAWRDLEERYADFNWKEKHEASFWCQTCTTCSAEHPWHGRRELDKKQGIHVIVNKHEILKTCLACGGALRGWEGYIETW